jgi:diacylglycerol kinase family enzyme/membrane-associated phospholipid phosphatase
MARRRRLRRGRQASWRRDLAAVALTRAADRWRIWLGAAAVVAAVGGRFGRRAALRGLVAAMLASLASNVAVKPVVRRRRPRTSRFRLTRLTSEHTSSSFPSGHTAVAVAFAAGAAQEQPMTAAVFAPLAIGVTWARVRAQEHHLSDVLGGGLIGAVAAVATRRLWPVAPHAAATARPALRRHQGRPAPDGGGVTIVVNPSAGPALATGSSDQLRDALPAAKVVTLDDDDDLTAVLGEAVIGHVLGVCGGDGSVNAAAAHALARDMPLLVVPGGTLNHFGRDVGLSSVSDAIDAVQKGELAEVDVGVVDGHTFLNTASFGAYSELVDARERLERRIGKWPALVVALVNVLLRAKPCAVEIDGHERSIWMIFIGNCCYHPAGFAPSWRERLDDGLFDVRIVDAQQPWSRTRVVASVLSGRLGQSRVYERRRAPTLRLRSLGGPFRLACDGETFEGSQEVVVEKALRRLAVVAPAPDRVRREQ